MERLHLLRLLQRDAPRQLQPVVLSPNTKPIQEWRLEVHIMDPEKQKGRLFAFGCTQGLSATELARAFATAAATLLAPPGEEKSPEAPATSDKEAATLN